MVSLENRSVSVSVAMVLNGVKMLNCLSQRCRNDKDNISSIKLWWLCIAGVYTTGQ